MARAGEGPTSARASAAAIGQRSTTADTHRSVYLPIVRDQLPEALALFDFADPSLVVGERATTTVPAQALYLMNSPFVIRQAEAAGRPAAARGGDDDAEQVQRAYQLFFGRPPTEKELQAAAEFLDELRPRRRRDRATWTAFCQALFASAEFANCGDRQRGAHAYRD